MGAAWMVAARFLVRSLGLISTLILARLLVPEDFGLVAIGVSMMQLLKNISDFGVAKAVVKYRDAGPDLLDTLFTLSFIRGVVTLALLVVTSFFASTLFDEPRSRIVFLAVSLVPFIQGLKNPKFYEFERDLDLSKLFNLEIATKIVSISVSIGVAVIFRNFWAIIAGMIASAGVETALSYVLKPYRPRVALRISPDHLKFMGWLTGLSFVTALNHKLDALLLPRLTDTGTTGAYYLGYQLVDLATIEISTPVATALFPGLSEQQNNLAGMKQTYLRGIEALGMIGLPIAFGMAFVADDLVPVLLGEGWGKIIPVLQIGAPIEALMLMVVGIQGYAIARDHTKLVFVREVIFFLIRTPLFIWAAAQYGILGAIIGASIGTIAKWAASLGIFARISSGHFWEPIWQVRRSLIGIAAMTIWFLVLKPFVPLLDGPGGLFHLAIDVVAGAIFYGVAVIAAWNWEGRPTGVESIMMSSASGFLRVKAPVEKVDSGFSQNRRD